MNIFDNFSVDRFKAALPYMGEGMLCIFIVIGLIIALISVVNFFSNKRASKGNDEQ